VREMGRFVEGERGGDALYKRIHSLDGGIVPFLACLLELIKQ
jgi:hypothetical protein